MRPATGDLKIDVRTRRSPATTSRGRPTLTESSFMVMSTGHRPHENDRPTRSTAVLLPDGEAWPMTYAFAILKYAVPAFAWGNSKSNALMLTPTVAAG